LKKKYASQLSQVKELFPNMAPEDILLELQENNGDLEVTVDKITEGRCPFSTHSMLHFAPPPGTTSSPGLFSSTIFVSHALQPHSSPDFIKFIASPRSPASRALLRTIN
jgi:hypothetical protein